MSVDRSKADLALGRIGAFTFAPLVSQSAMRGQLLTSKQALEQVAACADFEFGTDYAPDLLIPETFDHTPGRPPFSSMWIATGHANIAPRHELAGLAGAGSLALLSRWRNDPVASSWRRREACRMTAR